MNKKFYGVKTPISLLIFAVYGVFDYHLKCRKTIVGQSEIGDLTGLQLKLELIFDKGNNFFADENFLWEIVEQAYCQ